MSFGPDGEVDVGIQGGSRTTLQSGMKPFTNALASARPALEDVAENK